MGFVEERAKDWIHCLRSIQLFALEDTNELQEIFLFSLLYNLEYIYIYIDRSRKNNKKKNSLKLYKNYRVLKVYFINLYYLNPVIVQFLLFLIMMTNTLSCSTSTPQIMP